jgi:hypothetical protein
MSGSWCVDDAAKGRWAYRGRRGGRAAAVQVAPATRALRYGCARRSQGSVHRIQQPRASGWTSRRRLGKPKRASRISRSNGVRHRLNGSRRGVQLLGWHWAVDGPDDILNAAPGVRLLSWVSPFDSDTFKDVPAVYRVIAKVMSLVPSWRCMAQYHRYAF